MWRLFAGGRRSGAAYTPFYNDRLLLIGDLHCHSCHSVDGVFTPAQIARYCRDAGMDFAAITDHNSIGAFAEEDAVEDFLFLRGSETSLCEACGHFNVFGIEEIDLCPDMTEKAEIVAYMERMRRRGGHIQLNHPFAGTLGWHVGWDVPFELFEVWNRTYSPKNQAAIDWWHARLCAGGHIPVTGGTDSHTTKSERFPLNGVFARERTPEGILQAVLDGHTFITECSYGPWLQLRLGTAILGDTAHAGDGPLELYAENLERGYTVRLLSAAGEEHRCTVDRPWHRFSLTPRAERLFYRAEVWRGEKLAALSNPIYLA